MKENKTMEKASGETENGRKQSGGKYLTFKMANEEYGLEILKVREIIGMMDITSVPQTPDFVKGVINLRGKVIPVIDLRLKFGMEEKEITEETCTIVVEVGILTGIVVDTVSEVVVINEEQIEEPPNFGEQQNDSAILGMAKLNNKVIILLDIDHLMRMDELTTVEQCLEASNA